MTDLGYECMTEACFSCEYDDFCRFDYTIRSSKASRCAFRCASAGPGFPSSVLRGEDSGQRRIEEGSGSVEEPKIEYKVVTGFPDLTCSVSFFCILLKNISNIPLPFFLLSKTTSTKMKDSHLALVSLLAGSAPICQALSMPHWGSEPDTRLEKRLQRVAYAGINIAGCDFGMQTNVSTTHPTPSVS